MCNELVKELTYTRCGHIALSTLGYIMCLDAQSAGTMCENTIINFQVGSKSANFCSSCRQARRARLRPINSV